MGIYECLPRNRTWIVSGMHWQSIRFPGVIFIADLVLQILAYVAQTEREFIRQRQSEGIAAAKARGTKFGRSAMERPENYEQVKRLWEKEEISAREAARRLGITHRTFLKWIKNEEKWGLK